MPTQFFICNTFVRGMLVNNNHIIIFLGNNVFITNLANNAPQRQINHNRIINYYIICSLLFAHCSLYFLRKCDFVPYLENFPPNSKVKFYRFNICSLLIALCTFHKHWLCLHHCLRQSVPQSLDNKCPNMIWF